MGSFARYPRHIGALGVTYACPSGSSNSVGGRCARGDPGSGGVQFDHGRDAGRIDNFEWDDLGIPVDRCVVAYSRLNPDSGSAPRRVLHAAVVLESVRSRDPVRPIACAPVVRQPGRRGDLLGAGPPSLIAPRRSDRFVGAQPGRSRRFGHRLRTGGPLGDEPEAAQQVRHRGLRPARCGGQFTDSLHDRSTDRRVHRR